MDHIKKLSDEYLRALKSAEKSISGWEKQAKTFNDAEASRQETTAQIESLETQLVELEQEHDSLKEPYMDALFNQDASEQRNLQARKKKLDQEMSGVEKAISDKRAQLQPVDGKSLAELQATVDSFNLPDVYAFTDQLKASLLEAVRGLDSRAEDVAHSLPAGYDEQLYHDYRLEHDHDYRVKHEAQQRQSAASRRKAEESSKETQSWLRRGTVSNPATPVGDRVSGDVSSKPHLLDMDI